MKILRLWGIPIHKVLSDSEFVEKKRKWLRRSKKFAWIHVVVLVILSVICYAFMQSAGMVNDHLIHCFRYNQCG